MTWVLYFYFSEKRSFTRPAHFGQELSGKLCIWTWPVKNWNSEFLISLSPSTFSLTSVCTFCLLSVLSLICIIYNTTQLSLSHFLILHSLSHLSACILSALFHTISPFFLPFALSSFLIYKPFQVNKVRERDELFTEAQTSLGLALDQGDTNQP